MACMHVKFVIDGRHTGRWWY
uniref:Uncharacterized protein n=1 Tax=Arundo donax TaxID=35708 RepID=A0A0A9D4L5_ARUDO